MLTTDKNFLKDLGKRCADERRKSKKTQKEVEQVLIQMIPFKLSGCKGSTVAKWESGENEMTHLELLCLCEIYKSDANELLGLSPRKDFLPRQKLDLNIQSRIGNQISEYRIANHETQAELASVLGCKNGAVSKYETGVNGIPVSKFKKICDRYRMDAHDLFELPEVHKKATR